VLRNPAKYIIDKLRVQLFPAFTGANRDKARQFNLFDCRESRRASFSKAGYSRSIGNSDTTPKRNLWQEVARWCQNPILEPLFRPQQKTTARASLRWFLVP
jgi:hypothetical protein